MALWVILHVKGGNPILAQKLAEHEAAEHPTAAQAATTEGTEK